MVFIFVNRVEQHQISRSHPLFNMIDDYCYRAKNLYNYANYTIRQEYIKSKKYLNYYDLATMLKKHDSYKILGSQAAQNTLKLLNRDWLSFFASIKEYERHPEKYSNRPKLPKYKKKNGKTVWMLKNIQCRIEDNELIFAWKPMKKLIRESKVKIKTKVKGKLLQLRFIPKGSVYTMEIVYQVCLPSIEENNERITGIDLGLNNLITMVNNIGEKPIVINGRIIKSINHYYNKIKGQIQCDLIKRNKQYNSKKLERLSLKRDNKIKHYMHCASKVIINWCKENNIDTIVVGYNKGWKQDVNLGRKNNQKFVSVPFLQLINMLEYKAQNNCIKLITTEESFTSGCSFLDNEPLTREFYNKSRRFKRGLFKSNDGTVINSDVNGAYNIIRKVIPNAFANGIEGVDLHPVVRSMGY